MENLTHADPKLLRSLIEAFPLATIAVNGPDGVPVVAQVPVTFKQGITPNGAVEFHLARENPITALLSAGAPVRVVVNGPSCHVSPAWYTESFPVPGHRSHTVPTYDYLNATFDGAVSVLDMPHLSRQLGDIVSGMEATPEENWRLTEIDKPWFRELRESVVGYRIPVERLEITAKLSQNKPLGDRQGVVAGLKARNSGQDAIMATLIESFDGTPQSLTGALTSLRQPSSHAHTR